MLGVAIDWCQRQSRKRSHHKVVHGGLRRSPIARVSDSVRMIGDVDGRDLSIVKEYAIRQLLAIIWKNFLTSKK